MLKTFKEAFKMKDVRKKIFWTLILLLVYRIGCWIPIPGIDPYYFQQITQGDGGAANFMSLLSSLSGGALANGAILALGVGPYITSSIVMQLMTIAIPSLERLSKQGDEGRRKIAVYTRYVALVMALAQAIAITLSLGMSDNIQSNIFGQVPVFVINMLVILTLVAGSMFTVWIGDKITEHGVSNGMSMLIFVGIVSSGALAFYSNIVSLFQSFSTEVLTSIIVFTFTLVIIFFFIVFVDLGVRRIPVTYAKQVKGNKMYGGQNSHIPLKINSVGVIPIIFAFSLLTFPQLILSFFPNSGAYSWYSQYMGSGTWVNIILTGLLILGFSYFYASLSFNPDDVSRNIQQNGGFILGYRPGPPTRDYLKKVHNRITFFGALFLMFMAIVPSLIFKGVMSGTNTLTNAFTSIGMLIIVSVALEFDKQLQGQLLMKTYKGFLK